MVRIGDRVLAQLPVYFDSKQEVPLSSGTVRWIHQKRRWCRIAFKLPNGNEVTESFSIVNGAVMDAVQLKRKRR